MILYEFYELYQRILPEIKYLKYEIQHHKVGFQISMIKKFEIQEILLNVNFTHIFNFNMLLIFNQNYYLWDSIARLIILN